MSADPNVRWTSADTQNMAIGTETMLLMPRPAVLVEGPQVLPRRIHRELVERTAKTKDWYTVAIYQDGFAVCECDDYLWRGIAARIWGYQCIHIREVLDRLDSHQVGGS